jgi:hypothetical protein
MYPDEHYLCAPGPGMFLDLSHFFFLYQEDIDHTLRDVSLQQIIVLIFCQDVYLI